MDAPHPTVVAECARRVDWLKRFRRAQLPGVAKMLREAAQDPKHTEMVKWMFNWTAEQALKMHRGELEA